MQPATSARSTTSAPCSRPSRSTQSASPPPRVGAPYLAEQRLDLLEQPHRRFGIGFELHESHQASETRLTQVGVRDRPARFLQGLVGQGVHRQVEGGEVAEFLGARQVDADVIPAVALHGPGSCVARGQPFVEEGFHPAAALVGELDPIERQDEQPRSRHLLIEQQGQRVGQVDIREVPKHAAVQPSFDEAGQDGFAQQALTAVGVEREERARQPRQQTVGDGRIGRPEQPGDVLEGSSQRVSAVLRGRVVRHRHEHLGQGERIGHQAGEIRQRHAGEAQAARVHPYPALAGRVEVAGGSSGFLTQPVASADIGQHARRWHAHVEHGRRLEQRDVDPLDAAMTEGVWQRLRQGVDAVARDQLPAEDAQVTNRDVACECQRGD